MTLSNACAVLMRPAVLLRRTCCACVQGEGLELFVAYLRRLVGERAREDYSALVENTGESRQQGCLPCCNALCIAWFQRCYAIRLLQHLDA